MNTWQLTLDLSDDASPLFLRIARAISAGVQSGRLLAGARLPGTRQLAGSLGVHRNTVVAAYDELAAEGWIETSVRRGAFVARGLEALRPVSGAGSRPVGATVGFGMRVVPERLDDPVPKGTLVMSGGVPDVRLVPRAALARAWRRALTGRDGAALLGYGPPEGDARLRTALADMLRQTRGVVAADEQIVVTRGSQQALALAATTLVSPGDVVAVEALGYAPAWAAFRAAGAELVSVPVDEHGLDVEALAALAEKKRLRAVYVTPHHQYPTLATLAAARRMQLLELARRRRFAVIEDDYDHEVHYDGRPVLPLASADTAGVVVYVGSLAKVLAPGLRLGFLVGPRPFIQAAAAWRLRLDRQGDHVLERAIAELVSDGEIQRHARRMRRVYFARRQALVSALHQRLGDTLSFTVPRGGMALWAKVSRDIDAEAWVMAARAAGVHVQPARRFDFGGRPLPYLRLGFAALDEQELERAVAILARLRSGCAARSR